MATVMAREQQPFNDETRHGARLLSFNANIEGLRATVLYGFSKDKLYYVMYTMDTGPEQISAVKAEVLKQKLDVCVIAQLDRPRYMLCPVTGLTMHAGYSSWFSDAATLAQSLGTYLPHAEVLQYHAAFTDAEHREAVHKLKMFED